MKIPVKIYKVIRITAGGLHCWCDSNVGRIRKENKNVSDYLDRFMGIKEFIAEEKLNEGDLVVIKEDGKVYNVNLRWWQRLWLWLKQKLKLIK